MTKTPDGLDWIRNCSRRIMVGFHVPDYDQLDAFDDFRRKFDIPDLLEKVDPRSIVRAVRQAHMQAFWFYAKCHYGNAYYPSKVGHVHSAIKDRDLFGELCEACLAEGIVPMAVYEFSDFRMSKDHPDWCHKIPIDSGKVDITDAGQGTRVGGPCLNGPYGEFVIEQIREVLSRYPIRGLYLDFLGLFGFEQWICPYCNPKLKPILGRDFPGTDKLTHAEFVRYQQWRWAENDAYARRVRRVVKDLRPDVALTHNFHALNVPGNMQQFDFASRNCDFLSADLFHLRYGMLQLSWKLRLLAAGSKGKPAETLLDPMSTYQWDFRTPKALDSYKAELWTARSVNTAICSGFMIGLDGTFDRTVFALVERLMRKQKACEPWLTNMQPQAVFGLVRSGKTLAFRPQETAASYANVRHHEFEMEGWAQTLIAAHQLWDMVDESRLTPDVLRQFHALILPNVSCLSQEAVTAITDYVRQGGTLIATGDTSLYDETGRLRKDFLLAQVFGAHFKTDRNTSYTDLILEDKTLIPEEAWISPVLRMSDGQLEVRAVSDAICLGHVGQQLNPTLLTLQTIPTTLPGLLRHRFGRGWCWYFAGKPGLQYRIYGQNNVKRSLKTVLCQIVGDKAPVRLDAPDSVELFAHRQQGKKHLVVNLVNTFWGVSRSAGGFIAPDGKVRPGRFEEIENMPRLHAVTLRLPADSWKHPPRVRLVPDERRLPVQTVGKEYHVRLTNLGVHTMLVIE